jgi:hypothetical protein
MCIEHRYLGVVISVKAKTITQSSSSIRVQMDDLTVKTFQYPAIYLEKLSTPNNDLSELYPEVFYVGDVVDALYQDGKVNGKWYRGRIASVNEDGRACDVMYYDGDVSFCLPAQYFLL